MLLPVVVVVLLLFPLPLLSFAAQGYGVVSLAEGAVVLLMQCPLLVRAGIWNLFMMLEIARLFFVKDTMGSLTSTS